MCHLGIVMERGLCNLFQLLVREELDLFLRIDLMRQLARALHHLHTGDPHIIHRDVKPQNVVVTEAERSERTGLLKVVKVKLIDLGKIIDSLTRDVWTLALSLADFPHLFLCCF